MLLGVGAAILMIACCALLPLLIAGGAIAGLGGFIRNPWVVGVGIAVLVLVVITSAKRHRRSDDHDCCPPAPPTLPTRNDDADTKDDQNR